MVIAQFSIAYSAQSWRRPLRSSFWRRTPSRRCLKRGSTKNKKNARLYIQPELAADLQAHIATKAPKSPVFNLPHESNLARMLRDDLDEARKQWLTEAKDNPQEFAQRQQSGGCAFESCATSDEAFNHHGDNGHLRASIPRTKGRRGGEHAANAYR